MCDVTNLDYLNDQLRQLDGIKNVLEVGSYDVNGNCRASVTENGSSYVGVDIQQGPNVDRIVDITDEAAVSNKALPEAPFDLVICMNVLEHLYRPITAMDNMCWPPQRGWIHPN